MHISLERKGIFNVHTHLVNYHFKCCSTPGFQNTPKPEHLTPDNLFYM